MLVVHLNLWVERWTCSVVLERSRVVAASDDVVVVVDGFADEVVEAAD